MDGQGKLKKGRITYSDEIQFFPSPLFLVEGDRYLFGKGLKVIQLQSLSTSVIAVIGI